MAMGSHELHGSATAVRWGDDSRLALFHSKSQRGAYVTFAYLMEAMPPYAILNGSALG